jgi:hypothetical protein
MDAPLHDTPADDRLDTSLRLGTCALGFVVALATAAALASLLILGKTEAAPPLAAAPSATSGAPPQFDHSVVLRPGLRDEPLEPGASIAAYSAP